MRKTWQGVIILDNDPMIREILTECIRVIPHAGTLKTAKDLAELDEAFQEDFWLVVGELTLPDGHLPDWILQQRIRKKAVDFIPVTGSVQTGSYLRCRSLGAFDYILKPFRPERVSQAVKAYISDRARFKPDQDLTQQLLDRERELSTSQNNFQGNGHTARKLKDYIRSQTKDSFTAEEAARAMGVAKGTARRYLMLLKEEGFVEVLPDYGHIGRPGFRYRVSNREDFT